MLIIIIKSASLLKSHQNIHNSFEFEVIWKWQLMPIRKVHWISSASISGDKCIRQANDVKENPGPTIFDIIESADSSFVMSTIELETKILIDSLWQWNQSFFCW